jgi:hypothetical protein
VYFEFDIYLLFSVFKGETIIIVLDYLGNVMLKKDSADLGVCYPLSATFDSTGILWIGGSIAVDSEKCPQKHSIPI